MKSWYLANLSHQQMLRQNETRSVLPATATPSVVVSPSDLTKPTPAAPTAPKCREALREHFMECVVKRGCLEVADLNLGLNELQRFTRERVKKEGGDAEAIMAEMTRTSLNNDLDGHICPLPLIAIAWKHNLNFADAAELRVLAEVLIARFWPLTEGSDGARRLTVFDAVDEMIGELKAHKHCQPMPDMEGKPDFPVEIFPIILDLRDAGGCGAPMCVCLRAAKFAVALGIPGECLIALTREHGIARLHDWNALMAGGLLTAKNIRALVNVPELVRALNVTQIARLLTIWTGNNDFPDLLSFARENRVMILSAV